MFVNRSSGLQRLGPKRLTTQAKPLKYLGFWFDGTSDPMLSHAVPGAVLARPTVRPFWPGEGPEGLGGIRRHVRVGPTVHFDGPRLAGFQGPRLHSRHPSPSVGG